MLEQQVILYPSTILVAVKVSVDVYSSSPKRFMPTPILCAVYVRLPSPQEIVHPIDLSYWSWSKKQRLTVGTEHLNPAPTPTLLPLCLHVKNMSN